MPLAKTSLCSGEVNPLVPGTYPLPPFGVQGANKGQALLPLLISNTSFFLTREDPKIQLLFVHPDKEPVPVALSPSRSRGGYRNELLTYTGKNGGQLEEAGETHI